MAAPTEQRELELVDKLDFRILNVANKEAQLQELLRKFLAPLILKAGSEHASVRTKTVEVLRRVTTFIQPPGVVLPVAALIDQFKAATSPLIKQFDLVFIQHSLPRMEVSDRRELFPKVTKGIAHGDPNAAGPSDSGMFDLFLRLLADVKLPSRGNKDDDALRETLGLDDNDAQYLCKWLGKVLLLRPAGSDATAEALRKLNPGPTFSASELDFLVPAHKQLPPHFKAIADLKLRIVNFLATKAFRDTERLLPALYAACTADSRVSSIGDELLKKSSVDLENPEIVNALFEAHSHLAARYRIRILNLLCNSTLSTTMTDEIFAAAKLSIAPLDLSLDEGSVQAMNQPSGNLEKSKLHRALFQYLRWVASIGPSKGDFRVGPQLLDVMQKYIQDQGWPKPDKMSADDIELRSVAYEIIGIMGKAMTMKAQEKLAITGWMFRSLAEDPLPEVVTFVEGALALLSGVYSPNAPAMNAEFNPLRDLLLHHMTAETEPPVVRSTRHAALKWANRCLPFSDVKARWMNLLAVGGRLNERDEVVEEGRKGLDPWAQFAHSGKDLPRPDWTVMVRTYFGSVIRDSVFAEDTRMELDEEKSDSVFVNFAGDRTRAFPIALNYCKQMMFLAALKDFKMDPDWVRNLESRVKTNLQTREDIRKYLASDAEANAHAILLLKVSVEGMLKGHDSIVEDCARCFVEVASLCPRSIVAYQAEIVEPKQLLPAIISNKQELRLLGAEAVGILASNPANDDGALQEWAKVLSPIFEEAETKTGAQLNAAEGALMASAHLCSRTVFMGREIPSGVSYQAIIDQFNKETGPASLRTILLQALSELWTAGLAKPTQGDTDPVVLAMLKVAAKKDEKAVAALGKLSLAIDEEDAVAWEDGAVGKILSLLFGLHEVKEAPILFTIGEAIAAAVGCWDADCVKLSMNVDSPGGSFRKGKRSGRLTSVLDKLIKDCKETKPSLLKASGIWLFSIVLYCSHLDEVKAKLRECQGAFMRLVSTRDELTQEAASRGLSLVYEKGDAETREQLTKDLVAAFTGSGPKVKVEGDTELFDAGALPVGDGKSITSYKDIVSLASEVGDQTLVYKFMSLASNAAMWSTRSAFGRFGLSNILSESEVDPKIYPKLYRYRFDPNTNVQKSMEDIWKSMVKDSNAVLDEHFTVIMEDLLKSALGREWRVREASCGAIADLIHGRPFPKYEAYYTRIWEVALKLVDDVKGSVRNAAFKLCVGLTNTLVRLMEESHSGAQVKGMLKEVVPFLTSPQAIENKANDVQLFSTVTLLKICKKGGKHLLPYIPQLVSTLLYLLTNIEPGQIGMAYQKLGDSDRGDLDRARASMVNRSPISEAIDDALRFVDKETLEKLVPEFERSVKTALGMPTKIGCSRVLHTLFTSHGADMRPFAARFLQLMEKTILDPNDEVSKSYTRATAYIMRVATDASREKFVARLVTLYFAAEDEVRRRKVADAVLALGKISPDVFSSLESSLLPFAYMAQHDVDEYAAKAFATVWDQHAGSARTVGRYVQEITDLAKQALDTAKWSLRHTAAFAIAAMATALAKSTEATGQISGSNLKTAWPVFDTALALKTFDGKEKLLKAFPLFVAKAKALVDDDKIRAQMKKIAVREAKRNNEAYKVHALRCIWRFAEASGLDIWDDIVAICEPVLENFKDGDAMDVDEDADGKKVDKEALAAAALEAIARGYARPKMESSSLEVLVQILESLKPYLSSPKFAAVKRRKWYGAVKSLMEEAKPAPEGKKDETGAAGFYLLSLDPDLTETGTENERTERARAVATLVRAKSRGVFGAAQAGELEQFKIMVRGVVERERSVPIRDILKKVLEELEK